MKPAPPVIRTVGRAASGGAHTVSPRAASSALRLGDAVAAAWPSSQPASSIRPVFERHLRLVAEHRRARA